MSYRIAFGALFLVLVVVVAGYRRRAQAGRRIDYSKESKPIFVALRLGGLALWLYCLLYVVYPRPLGWSLLELPAAARWGGALVVAALIPFVAAAQRALGRNVSPTVITHEDHRLVTRGPYRWVRNPLYLSGALIFTGLGVLAASWFLVVAAALALVLVSLRLPAEEAELEARFGDAYRDYVRRTGRFVPRFRRSSRMR